MTQPPGWEIRYTPQAEKDLRGLRQLAGRARATIGLLSENPMRGQPLRGSLFGCRALHFRVPGQTAEYRAAYALNPERQRIVVFSIGSRENFYDEATRRAQTSSALPVMLEED